MISLSDEELAVIIDAARPLKNGDRDAFLRDVAAQLAAHPELGLGLVSRVARDVQRKYFAAPTLHGNAHPGRRDRGRFGDVVTRRLAMYPGCPRTLFRETC